MAALIADMNLDSTGEAWAQYTGAKSYKDADGNLVAMAGAENLTLGQAKNIHNATEKLGDFYGADMANEMRALFGGMAASLDEES
jgi:hypothetical protein